MTGVSLIKQNADEIKRRFSNIKNVSEFASLLNYVEELFYNNKEQVFPLTFSHLYFLSKTKNSRYSSFTIPKKNGDERIINSPDALLQRVQTIINVILQLIFEDTAHYCSNGFLLNRNICRNAVPHVGKKFLLNIDIENFFPSIDFRRIKVVLELAPFILNGQREKIAFLIANLATYNGVLPQGAPTSPILSNIVTQRLDRKITRLCSEKKIKYTRYADDLSFSANRNVFDEEFIFLVSQILTSENFSINESKTRLRTRNQSQEVTGLIVNEKVNIPRDFLQRSRAMLNNWDKGGLEYAKEIFRFHQPPSRKYYNFKNVLLGNLSFLEMVKGSDNALIQRMKIKFSFLDRLINYEMIGIMSLKEKLQDDNKRMELVFLEKKYSEDNFISFCTFAFYQIENLINYFFWRKFTYDNLLLELLNNNPKFGKSYKNLETAKCHFPNQKRLPIHVILFLYEKEFFFDKGKYYDKHLTLLREVRNDSSHRCSVIDTDRDQIVKDHENLLELRSTNKLKGIREIEQERIELKFKTLKFLERMDYNLVRNSLKEVATNIQKYFA